MRADGRGTEGWECAVGRLETGLGLGRVLAALGTDEVAGFAAVVAAGAGMPPKVLLPKDGADERRSLDAAGRSRGALVSLRSPAAAGTADGGGIPDRPVLEGVRRIVLVDLGAGRRDMGRGRPDLAPNGL